MRIIGVVVGSHSSEEGWRVEWLDDAVTSVSQNSAFRILLPDNVQSTRCSKRFVQSARGHPATPSREYVCFLTSAIVPPSIPTQVSTRLAV